MNLRGRYWELIVGTTRIAMSDTPGDRSLTIKFDISKSLDREPNKASIQICNLSPAHRQGLEQADSPVVQLVAGYKDAGGHGLLFAGDARSVITSREETDFWTTIESEDGGVSYRTATITRSFDAGVSLGTIIAACTAALGVGEGNSVTYALRAELEAGGAVFPDGIALEGPAWRALDAICRSANLRWSIQNGVLQLRGRRRAAVATAVLLSPQTGLIGSPTRSARDARTGRVNVEAVSLLQPALYPGRIVQVDSSTVTGNWLCHSVQYTGDSTGNDWNATLVLKDYTS